MESVYKVSQVQTPERIITLKYFAEESARQCEIIVWI